MKRKKIVQNILYLLIVIGGVFCFRYLDSNKEMLDDYKRDLYRDFDKMETALEDVNLELFKLMTFDEGLTNAENPSKYIERSTFLDFSFSNEDVSDYLHHVGRYDYIYVYLDLGSNLDQIVSDNSISEREMDYLKSVYSYTESLIKMHKSLFMTNRNGYHNLENSEAVRQGIFEIYEEFSSEAEALIHTDTYQALLDYGIDRAAEINDETRQFCKSVFDILQTGQDLIEDSEKSREADVYVFRTGGSNTVPGADLLDGKIEYKVKYNIETKVATVSAVSYVIPTVKLSEAEIDSLTEKVIAKTGREVSLYKREPLYDSDDLIYAFHYIYMAKDQSIQDAYEQVDIIIEQHGIISELSMRKPENIPIEEPELTEASVLEKAGISESEIESIELMRDKMGRLVYVMIIKFEENRYRCIFNANSGTLIEPISVNSKEE